MQTNGFPVEVSLHIDGPLTQPRTRFYQVAFARVLTAGTSSQESKRLLPTTPK
ncbi:hypothetical protein AGR1A_Cc20130 [Agrobacterium fabacearum CFBP 5771]|nr:hypothetical protein AGR1A_Cc20130 [Agrobacterium fabacearum CFBP 5771]